MENGIKMDQYVDPIKPVSLAIRDCGVGGECQEVFVVDKNGREFQGNKICYVSKLGVTRVVKVNPKIGFKLDDSGRIQLTDRKEN